MVTAQNAREEMSIKKWTFRESGHELSPTYHCLERKYKQKILLSKQRKLKNGIHKKVEQSIAVRYISHLNL
jgi:hypothetical protein